MRQLVTANDFNQTSSLEGKNNLYSGYACSKHDFYRANNILQLNFLLDSNSCIKTTISEET